MRKFSIIITLLLIATTVSAAGNYVFPPYQADSLMGRFSYSAAVSGIGECGVTNVDPYSFYYNPGSVGLLADEQLISIGFNPQKAHSPSRYYDFTNPELTFYSIAFSIKSFQSSLGRWSFGAAYYIDDIKSTDVILHWLYAPSNAGDTLKLSTDNFVFGFGLKGKVEFGAGFTLRKIKSNQIDTDFGDNWSYNFGFMLRKKFYLNKSEKIEHTLTPALGVVWKNYGDPYLRSVDIYGDYVYTQKLDPISTRYLGGSIKYRYSRDNLGIIEVKAALEYERRLKTAYYFAYDYNGWLDYVYKMPLESTPKLGIEAGFVESLYLRYGKIHEEKYGFKVYTWGFSLKTDGLFKRLKSDEGLAGILKRLSVEFAVAGYYNNEDVNDFYNPYYINSDHDRIYSLSISFR